MFLCLSHPRAVLYSFSPSSHHSLQCCAPKPRTRGLPVASACAEALSDWKELPPDRGLRLGPCEPPGPAQPQERSGAFWPITTLLACLGHPFPSPSCHHRRGHVPADLQTEHFVSVQRAKPETRESLWTGGSHATSVPLLSPGRTKDQLFTLLLEPRTSYWRS